MQHKIPIYIYILKSQMKLQNSSLNNGSQQPFEEHWKEHACGTMLKINNLKGD
jgi:hypothetical protein